MQSIRSWFLQPFPFERRWAYSIRAGAYAGSFVTLFLFFLRPFGTVIKSGEEGEYLLVCSFYGLVTLAITVLAHAFCLLFPKIFDEEKWNVWKEILFNLCFVSCIGMGNLLLAHQLWSIPMNGKTFWGWQGITFMVGVFPIFFGVFMGQMKLSKKYIAEAAQLHLPIIHPTHEAPITFLGENQNETLVLQAAQIAYLAAQDNYVQVFYFENTQLKSRMLRATLRKMEETLTDSPQFVRCHRTFLANFDKIEKVSGNAQGYRLHLTGVEETIPVSRNLNDLVRSRLTDNGFDGFSNKTV
jgi:hypothetical protein